MLIELTSPQGGRTGCEGQWVTRFAAAERPGAYARVLHPGVDHRRPGR
ncbi:MAG: hypothetical protein H0W14_00255 [Actinobacteria bacterium]|nr:hypothetical protein [Actinomycetota bacterium]